MLMQRVGYLIVAIGIIVFPIIVSNTFFIFLGQTLAYTTIAVIGLNLLLALSGQMSLGQSGFYAIGAYGSAILATTYGWPLFATMLVGVGLATLCGVMVGLVALRTRGLYLAMATLAFGFIVEILAQRWVELTGGTMGLYGVPSFGFGNFAMAQIYFFWAAGLAFLVIQMVSDYVFASSWGRNLLAIKESESFARTIGLNVPLWRTGVFTLSALLAGLAGVFFAHQSGYVSSAAFDIQFSLALLVAVVIGGLGHSYGPILGASLLMSIDELTAGLHEIGLLVHGIILLLVLLVFPKGAIGLLRLVLPGSESERMKSSSSLPSFDLSRAVEGRNVGLSIEGLTKSYAGVVAVDNVSIDVQSGTVHALIGPNGAGKSTVINVLSGLYRPDRGRILLSGREITTLPAHQRAKLGISRTFQNLQLIDSLTVLENVMLGMSRSCSLPRDIVSWLVARQFESAERERASAILAFLGVERLSVLKPGDLPYGHRKLCELARAIAQEPALMLLDEPIAGLNPQEVREIADVIRRLRDSGVTILLIEHNMDFVMDLSDRVTVLDYGKKIAEGTPQEVQRDQKVIGAYLGTENAA